MSSTEAAPKRVLGIVGSPRRGGNTEVLVDQVLRGAQEAGAEIEKVILNELDIGPCQACAGCRDGGECVLQDDMAALLQRMQDSHVWVLGTPVYWWGPTAQFKAFLDRWYITEHRATSPPVEFETKQVVLVIPLGGSARDARHTSGMIEDALAYKRSVLFATIIASGVEKKGAVRGRADVLAQARQAGREVVERSEQEEPT